MREILGSLCVCVLLKFTIYNDFSDGRRSRDGVLGSETRERRHFFAINCTAQTFTIKL
jgi:hypothetical protein